jgi:hypothetical protein
MKFSIFFCQIIPIINWNTVIKNNLGILKYTKYYHSIKKSPFLSFQFSTNFNFGKEIREILWNF